MIGPVMTDGNKTLERKKLANKNLRLAVLLAFLALSIYCGYIMVYYISR